MKKGTIILGSIIGGAVLGAAVTLCATSKSGREMRRMAHEKILAQLEHLHDHIKQCSCMSGGDCELSEKPKQEGEMGEMMM